NIVDVPCRDDYYRDSSGNGVYDQLGGCGAA
uniref:U-actitoxin-Bcg2a n=1 Tax=Bunodosoma cangicum TaxID=138296 RepID=BBHA2_BUNCN|nr:RecName: Full=U-actitoxin-Bcg2a; Short=U-AITX-Bcg2a; AltName: Full=AnmTX BC 9a-3; AltName: Full=Bcg III 21.75; Short=Bcg 21.75 [Bunodosoma cangicum]